MVLHSLVRLRRLHRATKFVLAFVSACLVSYFVFTFYKGPITVASPVYFDVLSSGTGYTRALNVHLWRGLCGLNVSYLHKSPFYPRYPDEKMTISEFQTEDKDTDFGELIFGFVHPSKTGLYRFGIASDDTSELWLSSGEDPNEKRLIARVYSATESAWTEKGDLKKYSDQISGEIKLVAGSKYYIEAVLKQSAGIGFIQVYWASPPDSEFQIISSEYLSLFSEDTAVVAKKDVLHKIYRATGVSKKRINNFDRQYLAFYSLPRLPKGHFLPPCVYKSSFVLKDKIAQYNGIRVVYESNVYPGDDTRMGSPDKVWSWSNRVADKELIHSIVQKIMASLQLGTSKDYVLNRIHKVLQKSDPVYGDRFSLDLEVGLKLNTNQSYRLSEHVYLQKGTASLCFPEGIEWNNNATVYFILPVKDQGKWVYHFLNQLTEASLLTGDTNFHVIVIDFESQDIDMKRAFNTSLLSSRHTVVNLQGKFYKTLALNQGVELVPSPHDIVLLFDLHIDVPIDILDSVRKNTIEGRIAYFPIVGRLDCESTSDEHSGFWEMDGYGILGVYKADWIRFGGMNTEDFKYQWGGEDWDLLDRVLNAQLEVERVRYPGLYHHYHSKQQTWN